MAKKNTAASKPKSRASSQSASHEVRSVSAVKWISTGQLALKSGLCIQTIRNDIERGKIIAHQTRSGRHIISREEAERYLLENGYAAVSFN